MHSTEKNNKMIDEQTGKLVRFCFKNLFSEGLALQKFEVTEEFYTKYEISNDSNDFTINSLAQIGMSHPF